MQNTIFMVNDEPYCIWDVDLVERNKSFLKGLDPGYFEYILKTHGAAEDEKRAAVALKIGLHHALETFFSLLGAYVQAPDCAYAWIAKCQTQSLRDVVSKIGNCDDSLFRKIKINAVSWEEIARHIFASYMPGMKRQEETVNGFCELWQRIAHEFLNSKHADEYNSLKHGFRVGSGGFSFSFSIEPSYGVPPPDGEYNLLGEAEHGSSYFKIEPLTNERGERSLIVERNLNNWSIEKVILMSQLVNISINNVVSSLRIVNGFSPEECLFLRPEDQEGFLKPWDYSTGVTSMSLKFGGDMDGCVSLKKKEILDILGRKKSD